MGYRSQVAIALHKSDWQKLRNSLIATGIYTEDDLRWAFSSIEEPREGYIVVSLDDTKWYEEYHDVKFIMDFLDGVEHQFVRIGDYYDDIEFRNTFKNGEAFFYPESFIKYL